MTNILDNSRKKSISSSFKVKEVEKAGGYTEGVYSDTPANRKLGRVGMSYKQYKEKNSGENSKVEDKWDEDKAYETFEKDNTIQGVKFKKVGEHGYSTSSKEYGVADREGIVSGKEKKLKDLNNTLSNIKNQGALLNITIKQISSNQYSFVKDYSYNWLDKMTAKEMSTFLRGYNLGLNYDRD